MIFGIYGIESNGILMLEYEYINECVINVPDAIKYFYDIDLNPYFLEEFHLTIYDIMKKLPYRFQTEMCKQINPKNSIGPGDQFITFKMSQLGVDIIGQTQYVPNESLPFHFNLVDDGLLCDFIDATTLEDKLISSSKRYMAFDVDFVSEIARAGHSICMIFDKHKRTGFLLDSNGSLSYFDNPVFGSFDWKQLIHNTMEFYCGLLGYNYIKLSDCGVNIKLNYKINSEFQKSWFQGYCKGWTLFFMMVALTAPDNFEFVDWLGKFSKVDPKIFNKIVEIFQVWFYWTYQIDKIQLGKINQTNFEYLK